MTDLSVLDGGTQAIPLPIPANPRRKRSRRKRLKLKPAEIVDRVTEFKTNDERSRGADIEQRLQRRAKLRMWTEGKEWPWEDASDIGVPDIMTASLRTQDTLHNAVMSMTPVLTAVAIQPEGTDKQEPVEDLIHHQLFHDQNGETIFGELIDAFVNEGVFTAFVPWVKESREVVDMRSFDPIPDEEIPAQYFAAIMSQHFPEALPRLDSEGWDWVLFEPKDGDPERAIGRVDAAFYTRENGDVELVIQRSVESFNGPKVIPIEYEDIFHPPRAGNLQIPGPSNPTGASHVIIKSRPTLDEIRRLARNGWYTLSKDELRSMEEASAVVSDEPREDQEDTFRGVEGQTELEPTDRARSHKKLTRLMCFDTIDIDGDGIDEDVIWFVIEETRTLAKWAVLTELYPSNPPRRPLAEAQFIPVRGRRTGIGIPELLEGIHDTTKEILDQTVDAGTLMNSPFFFYRAVGNLKPETIRLWPGEGYPLADPDRDVNFPNFPNRDQSFGLNMLGILQQWDERLSMIGDLQLGRVPPGRSSALRTIGGMALLSGQAEARPERILRRFFNGIVEIAKQVHQLNQSFLPREKIVRRVGGKTRLQGIYRRIQGRSSIEGPMDFVFKANVLNTSRLAMQENLEALFGVMATPLALQMGLTDPPGLFRLMRDYVKSRGQDPERYLTEPAPKAHLRPLSAEEALRIIINDGIPDGAPREQGGAVEHLQKLDAIEQSDDFGLLKPQQIPIWALWKQEIQEEAQFQLQREQLAQAAAQQQGGQQGQPGRPPTGAQPNLNNPPLQGAELLDETLPGAGGGGGAPQNLVQ